LVIREHIDQIFSAPSELLHVGKNYELDYVAAKNAGCGSVLMRRTVNKDESIPNGVPTISNLEQLEKFLAKSQ
jgi:FMN phosphatase YigB (HAD superfamily)